MSRSGYSDDIDNWALIRWRGAVASATRGKRGQALFREILAVLDAMPERRLVRNDLVKDGAYCTLGALGAARGTPMGDLDPDDYEQVAKRFGINEKLAQEIMYMNDEADRRDKRTPEDRWLRMREWVAKQIKTEEPTP